MTRLSGARWGHWLAVLAVMIGGSQPCLAQNKQSQTVAEMRALLDKHDQALNRHDLQAIMALYAPGPKTVMMGTGPGERYQGLDQIREAYREFFKDFDRGTLSHNTYWRDGARNGNLAWMVAQSKFADSKAGRRREYEINASSVFERIGGRWLIRTLHYSNLTSPAATAAERR